MVSSQKSTIHFSGATRNKHELIQVLQYREGEFSIKYLGLPLAPRILSEKECKPLLDSISAMIAGWKKKLLSHVGRVQLFHWGVMGIFNLWNQACRLPQGTLKTVQSLTYNYTWIGKRDFSWDVMMLPKEEGGWGLGISEKLQ